MRIPAANTGLRLHIYLLSLLTIVLTGCASSPPYKSDRHTYSVDTTSSGQSDDVRLHIVKTAASLQGAPYKYGGASSRGFDCSGLVYYSYGQAGIRLPRTARHQFESSKKISANQLQAGDLVFFRISSGKPEHVGIYLGNNRFIHAPSSGKRVGTSRLNDGYWKKRYIGAGSYF